MTEVNAVEELRAAATAMRDRALAATPAPWDFATDGLVWALPPGDPVSGSSDVADAEHIAGWDPAVALAIADWLESGANPYSCHDREPMLKVARAYLGTTKEAS